MPGPLDDPRHEAFARFVAQGKTHTEAATLAGYAGKYIKNRGSKLATYGHVRQRIAELQTKIEERVVEKQASVNDFSIASAARRMEALERRWKLMEQILSERASDPSMAKVPGGRTGLIVRRVRAIGTGANVKIVQEFEVDTGLLREMRAHEERADIEITEWHALASDSLRVPELPLIETGTVTLAQGESEEPLPVKPGSTDPKPVSLDSPGLWVQGNRAH